jgi:hypothetical protein
MVTIEWALNVNALSGQKRNARRQMYIFNATAFQKDPFTLLGQPFDKPVWPVRGLIPL